MASTITHAGIAAASLPLDMTTSVTEPCRYSHEGVSHREHVYMGRRGGHTAAYKRCHGLTSTDMAR